MPDRLFVVDDERLIRETLAERLRDEGYEVEAFSGAYEALEAMAEDPAGLVLTDLRMPSMDGDEFHRRIRNQWPDTEVVFMTAFGTVASAVAAMREGAADYLTKPLNTEELIIRLQRINQRRRDSEEIRRLRAEVTRRRSFGDLVFRSSAMRAAVDRAMAVAETDSTVLVRGATGTGKEVLCRAIHGHSGRANGPFVAVNAAGLNPNLVESELFGHEVGSFTGATRMRKGRLEIAGGGTLLIDEVDDLSLEVQVRLLRFLQDRTFERVGSSKTLHADVRVLCATKRDLQELVDLGQFRDDLYYRINTVLIEIPPLRERREDIAFLADHFLLEACSGRTEAGKAPFFTPEALRALLTHGWPGNVRELKHAVEHACAFARGEPIRPEHLPDRITEDATASPVRLHFPPDGPVSLTTLTADCERQAIEWAMTRAGGNQAKAAELLSIPRTTLRSRIEAINERSAEAAGEAEDPSQG